MKYTLKEAVDVILSSIDGDEVNDINDTVESAQVALLLKSCYYDLATELNLSEHEGTFELTASGDNTKPTLMTVPSNVVRLDWVKYDNILSTETYPNYQPVEYIPFGQFLEQQQSLRNETSNVGSMTFTHNGETFEVQYKNNKMPEYFTTVDDNTLLFDSYDSDEDTTLQNTKSMGFGWLYPTFTLSNTFTPDLDPSQFAYWVNKAKFRAFQELKQQSNPEAGREARNQKIITQKHERKVAQLTGLERTKRFGKR